MSSPSSAGSNGSGVMGSIKQVADKARDPAVVVAGVAGVAGGLLLKRRQRRKTVLGVPLTSSFGKSLGGIDAKALAKSVGRASKQFAKTAKSVSKDLERAGKEAERLGKILD